MERGLYFVFPLSVPYLKKKEHIYFISFFRLSQGTKVCRATQNEEEITMKKNTKPIVFAFANQKGGVGKTTTAMNIAVALGLKGYKVLMIDLDPSESLSNFFGIYGVDTENNIGDMLLKEINEQEYDITDYIIHDDVNKVDIIPSEHESMKALDKDILNRVENGELILDRALSNNKNIIRTYDFIIIDCPATLDYLTDNALSVANYVIIPCQASPIVFAALPNLYNAISDIKDKHNKKLSVLGIVATLAENSKSSRMTLDMLEKNYKEFFRTYISKQAVVSESALKEKAVVLSNAKDNKAAQQYRALTDDILERLG